MRAIYGSDGRNTTAAENPDAALVWYDNAGERIFPPGMREPRRFDLGPWGELPMHNHDGPDHEVLIPLVGEFEVMCADGERATIGVGDMVVSGLGQAHAVRNLTGEPAVIFIFATPAHPDEPRYTNARVAEHATT